MKKNILILIAIFACIGVSKGQSLFPASQYIGTAKTNLIINGGARVGKGFINKVYTDTTDANLDTNYIKMYPGAQIVTSDNQFWIRNLLAARWVPVIATSSGITVSASSPLSVTGTPSVNPNIVADTSTLHPYALVTQNQLVKYSFSGLLNNDGLKYDSANNRWINFRRVFTAPLSYNYNTNTLILLPLDSTNVPDLHSETYYNGKYWKANGNQFPAGTTLGTTGNTSFRMIVNGTQFLHADSLSKFVGIGQAANPLYQLSVGGAIFGNSATGVSLWLPNGNAIRAISGSANIYLDNNPGIVNIRATTLSAQAAVVGTSSITSGTFMDANLGFGYRTGGQTVLTLKVDSSYMALNNNTTVRKVLYSAETNFFNDDATGPNNWFGSGASSSLAEFRSASRGVLFPGISKAARDAMVFTGVGGTKVAGIVSGSGYTSGNYGAVALTTITGAGTGATAKIVVNSGAVTQVSIIAPGSGYAIGDSLSSSSIGAGTGFRYAVGSLSGRSSMTVYDTTTNTTDVWNGANWTGSMIASSAGTLTLKYGEAVSFTGTTATYTLPAVSATIMGSQNSIQIKNRGSGAITLNSNTGSTIYTTAAVGTLSIPAGETASLIPDGTYFAASFGASGSPGGTYLPLAGTAYTTTTGTGLLLSSSTLTTGNLMSLTLTGTAATSNTKNGLAITSSGANANASQTVTAQTISVTNTGTTNTNVGLDITAGGGSTANNQLFLRYDGSNYTSYSTGSAGVRTVNIVGSAPTYAWQVAGTNKFTLSGTVLTGFTNYLPNFDATYNIGSNTSRWLNAYFSGGIGIGGTAIVTDKLEVTGNLALMAAGNKIKIVEGSNGSVGQTTLVAGTKAITITGLTTSSRATVTFVSIGGTVTTTWQYAAVCTANTLTITALTTAGATNTSDTSVLNYLIIN